MEKEQEGTKTTDAEKLRKLEKYQKYIKFRTDLTAFVGNLNDSDWDPDDAMATLNRLIFSSGIFLSDTISKLASRVTIIEQELIKEGIIKYENSFVTNLQILHRYYQIRYHKNDTIIDKIHDVATRLSDDELKKLVTIVAGASLSTDYLCDENAEVFERLGQYLVIN